METSRILMILSIIVGLLYLIVVLTKDGEFETGAQQRSILSNFNNLGSIKGIREVFRDIIHKIKGHGIEEGTEDHMGNEIDGHMIDDIQKEGLGDIPGQPGIQRRQFGRFGGMGRRPGGLGSIFGGGSRGGGLSSILGGGGRKPGGGILGNLGSLMDKFDDFKGIMDETKDLFDKGKELGETFGDIISMDKIKEIIPNLTGDSEGDD